MLHHIMSQSNVRMVSLHVLFLFANIVVDPNSRAYFIMSAGNLTVETSRYPCILHEHLFYFKYEVA